MDEHLSAATLQAAENMGQEEVDRAINGLVRIAISCERRKTALKRDEILKKLLPNRSKALPVIFKGAQERLRSVFGMELVPLPVRKGRRHDTTTARSTKKDDTTGKATASGFSYILCSIIGGPSRFELVPWGEEDLTRYGFLALLLSLIFVHGGSLGEDTLQSLLLPFNIHADTRNRMRHERLGDIDELLSSMVKAGYLDKTKVRNAERETVEWIWGPRAKVEFDDERMIAFIAEMFGPDANAKLIRNIRQASSLTAPAPS